MKARMPIPIRPAPKADQATITRPIEQARLNPCHLHWANFLIAEVEGQIAGLRQVKIHNRAQVYDEKWRKSMTETRDTEQQLGLPTIYAGWHHYQSLLITTLQPLSLDQLALRAAPHLRSIGEIGAHIISARVYWFYEVMGEGDEAFAMVGTWDGQGMPARSAAELIEGLAVTWEGMQAALNRWTPADWQQRYPGQEPDQPASITRPWVIWHLIEHDLHHGGEIGLTLGQYGLSTLDL